GTDLGTAEFIDSRLHRLRNRLDRGFRHILDVNRLETGVGGDYRKHRHVARHAGEAVEEPVLDPEDDRGAQDHGVREGSQHRMLACRLGAGILAVALRIGTNGRDLDETPDPELGCDAGDPAGSFGLDRVKSLTAGGDENPDAVDDGIDTVHCASHRGLVTDIRLDWLDLADDAIGADKNRVIRPTDGYPDPPPLAGKALADIATDKAGTAKDCDDGCDFWHG